MPSPTTPPSTVAAGDDLRRLQLAAARRVLEWHARRLAAPPRSG